MKNHYVHREIETSILNRTKEFPVIVLTGPRQTGKSTMLKAIFPKYNYVSLDDPRKADAAIGDPALFLENYLSPLIIDEIQYAPDLLRYIKLRVDGRKSRNGMYILTGSQIFPLMSGVSESLAGRAALFELLGFSLDELPSQKHDMGYNGCFNILYRGFYPAIWTKKADVDTFYSSYLSTYLERDVRQVRSVHDLKVFQKFLELLAARSGSILNLSEVSKECGVSHTTAQGWLSILETSRIVYLLRPYHRNITKRVIKSPKLYFTDTGLLAYLLRYPNSATLGAGPIAGHVFENMMIIDVLKYKFNHNKKFEMYFMKDSNANEVDLLIDYGNKVQMIEFKTTKTIKKDHMKSMLLVQKSMKTQEMYIVSFFDEEIKLGAGIKSLPWRRLNSVLK
ncbi:MAG: ATP-binding protein [Candidatus Omnitrophota bacterium]